MFFCMSKEKEPKEKKQLIYNKTAYKQIEKLCQSLQDVPLCRKVTTYAFEPNEPLNEDELSGISKNLGKIQALFTKYRIAPTFDFSLVDKPELTYTEFHPFVESIRQAANNALPEPLVLKSASFR